MNFKDSIKDIARVQANIARAGMKVGEDRYRHKCAKLLAFVGHVAERACTRRIAAGQDDCGKCDPCIAKQLIREYE